MKITQNKLREAIHQHESTDDDHLLDDNLPARECSEYEWLKYFISLHTNDTKEIVGATSLIAGQERNGDAFFYHSPKFNDSTIYYGVEFQVNYDAKFNVWAFENMFDNEKWYSPSLLSGLRKVDALESTRTDLGVVKV